MTPTPAFALLLEDAAGGTRTVPIGFDFANLDEPARAAALDRWDGETPVELAASLLFATTGLDDDDWPAVEPVLVDLLAGDLDRIELVYGE